MIYKIRLSFLWAIVCVGLLVVSEPGANAQEIPLPKIGIVDVQLVLRDSKAAKSIRPEYDKMRKAFQKQVSAPG